jgi:hypothetical protein
MLRIRKVAEMFDEGAHPGGSACARKVTRRGLHRVGKKLQVKRISRPLGRGVPPQAAERRRGGAGFPPPQTIAPCH